MIRVLPNADSLARAAADVIARILSETVEDRGRCTLALAGGNTPVGTYRALAGSHRESVPWGGIHFLWGDERMVPPDHPDSNFGMARRELLSPLHVSDTTVTRIRTELGSAEEVAADYEARLRILFPIPEPDPPRLDLVLLGLGEDGHTASLMPECRRALGEETRMVTWCTLERLAHPRVTLSLRALNAARGVIFLVEGEKKASVLRRVLEGDGTSERLPAQRIRPEGADLLWLVDTAAASALSPRLRDRAATPGGAHEA